MKKKSSKIALLIGGVIFVAGTFLVVGNLSARSYVYVNDGVKGKMDGSQKRPFDSIQDAIDKAEDKDKDVFVFNGYYEENIEIWDDVKVIGEERGGVVIEAEDDDEPTVAMYDDTEISKLRIKGGKYGVRVKKWSEALIEKCEIVDNDKDGIKARIADTSDKGLLEVYDSYIARNGKNGIYVEKRKVRIDENTIEDNENDGIDLSKGSEGKVKNNSVKNNEGDGMKVTIDGSELEIKDNTLKNNDREGIEVRAEGATGWILLEDNKYYRNERFGIARVERSPFSDYGWAQSLTIDGGTFWDNERGGISWFIKVY